MAQQAAAAPLDHRRGQRQVARVAGVPGELDERRLDLRMAVEARLAALVPEPLDGQVGEAAGDLEHVLAPGSAGDRDGGLDQVAGAVQLVALLEVPPALLGVHALDPGVQVAVVLLGRPQQSDRVVEERAPPGVAGATGLPADRLEHLVEVGVGEPQAAELGGRRRVGDAAEVVEVAARLEPGDAVVDRRGPVELLPGAQESVAVKRGGAVVERPAAEHAGRPSRAVSRVHTENPEKPFRKVASDRRPVKIFPLDYPLPETGRCT